MKVLHINKSDTTGGAAIAAMRIVQAQRQMGIDARMLVVEKRTTHDFVQTISPAKWQQKLDFGLFVAERLYFLPYERDKSVRFAFSPAVAGTNISRHPWVAEADVLHLHWFNQGYLSLRGLRQLLALGKPVVWTLHDMWAFTGGCHYTQECTRFEHECGHCPMLSCPAPADLSRRGHHQKRFVATAQNLQIVCCSQWLASIARTASLMQKLPVQSVPNSIDIQHFAPTDRLSARQQLGIAPTAKWLLFGAANVDDARKGFAYVLEALHEIRRQLPTADIRLLLFGKTAESTLASIPVPYHHIPYANAALLPQLYNAADAMLMPSLQDNLPNTVMESLSCGTPVVAFATGGIPEMVPNGINGYLVPPTDAQAMARATVQLLQSTAQWRTACRQHVETQYSPQVVAQRYAQIYAKKG